MAVPLRISAVGIVLLAAAAVGLVLLTGSAVGLAREPQAEPILPVEQPRSVDTRRAALGGRLFSDVRLSRSGTYACATCHPLDRGGMDGLTVAERSPKGVPPRNTPTIFNVALNASFNWDGGARSLDEHAETVIQTLMEFTWPDLVARLRGIDDYRAAFDESYDEGLTKATVIDAIVSYEHTLITPDAPFDRYLRGDTSAISPEAREGYRRFQEYGCAACHQGANVGGNLHQRFGIFPPAVSMPLPPEQDPGRFRITKIERDRHVFRVPSLRNVAVTAPYFHDGRATSLEKAVEIMGQRQLGRTLTPTDIRLIVSFLHTLTGEHRGRPLVPPRLSRTEPRNR